MMERFTKSAHAAVVRAVQEAEREHAEAVEPPHLLLALLASPVLAEYALSREEIEHDFREARRKGGLTGADADALRGLGIDVDAVVASVERSHGEGVLARRRGPRRRRFAGGHVPFHAAAREILVRSLREARDFGHRGLGDEHLLLALLAGDGVVPEVLRTRGVDYAAVRRRVAAAS
ncbi:Clp protease N-terminal domain-containing protein [Umezawaea beigongshangensis]|uniref:Clp protease N-terminal domain-containing protein n=1 Tax=Umezawaea beigongshangensis TaxID=2780383 RepID=UPI0018F11CA3|nr:Clp protease N-terminal domain-containing protein [Umezawaea beigongshangensis]